MGAKGILRSAAVLGARYSPLRRILIWYYEMRSKRSDARHSIDERYGIETSGSLPPYVLVAGHASSALTTTTSYVGSQPNVLRAVLRTIPNHADFGFIDIGSGKGRALVVASEFPFRSITGLEISPELASLSRTNAKRVASAYPHRTPIAVVAGDALSQPLPSGDLVIFLYNPFGEDLTRKLVANVETALSRHERTVLIVYYNPVCAKMLDTSAALVRTYAESIPYDKNEAGYRQGSSDVVAIWQDSRSAPTELTPAADRQIVVIDNGDPSSSYVQLEG